MEAGARREGVVCSYSLRFRSWGSLSLARSLPLSVTLSVSLSISLSVRPSVHPPVCLTDSFSRACLQAEAFVQRLEDEAPALNSVLRRTVAQPKADFSQVVGVCVCVCVCVCD